MKFPYGCVLGVFLAACSSPRYTYYFPQPASLPIEPTKAELPIMIPPAGEQELEASADEIIRPAIVRPKSGLRSQKPSITFPSERTMAQPATAGPPDAARLSDSTFKLSLIFFVGGLIIWAIGGPVFTVIGSLAMLTGVVFGIKWFFKK